MPTQKQVDRLQMCIYDSEAELALNVAKRIEEHLQSLLVHQEVVTLILATGNTQISFLKALTETNIDWSRLTLFHLDEYLGIEPTHPASFHAYLWEKVHKRVHPQQFHYINGDTLQPLLECDRYIKLLSAQPVDLCFLGVGENGHLAFNEPAVADFNDPYPMKVVRLNRSTRLHSVDSGEFSALEAVPQYAFTLTIPTICAAQKIACLALGTQKAAIVKQMLTQAISTTCPASVLRQHPNATLYLDADAASLL